MSQRDPKDDISMAASLGLWALLAAFLGPLPWEVFAVAAVTHLLIAVGVSLRRGYRAARGE
jgi:hypothetical protein